MLHCNIAGFTYWDGCIAFERLKTGTELELEREPYNSHDHNAIAIYYDGLKLGYIPSSHNAKISMFLDMGHKDIFETRISRICEKVHPESQIFINIYIKNKHYYGNDK